MMKPLRSRPISLLWKILFSTSIAITVLFGLLEWIVQDQFTRIASQSVEEEVRASFQAYDSLWRARADQLASVSLVLSRMPDVRSAFQTGDRATIRDTAGEVWEKIPSRGALFLVADPRGAVLAGIGAGAAGEIRDLPFVRQAASRFPGQSIGFIEHSGSLFQVVVTPVYVDAGQGPALINVLAAGMPVDATVAGELKAATGGSEFVFRAGGREVASTLPSSAGKTLGKYTQFTAPLRDIGGAEIGELRILRSFDGPERRIAGLRSNLLWAWAATILAGIALTYGLARHLLRPIKELDAAAVQIAAGNHDVKLDIRSDDEIGRLAATFNSMAAAIRRAQQELIRRERITTIGRLGTSIVHDLRNPLASIFGGAEMLVDDDLSPPQVKRLAANIYRASRRVQELLQELTDISKGRAHGREMCRLQEIVAAARQSSEEKAAVREVVITAEIDPQIELPLARSPMERVFQNLIGNAIEAMPTGGVVTVKAKRDGSDVLLSIEDTGPGIPEDVAAQLFQPFVRSAKNGGMGLGLALARETVREHGGELWLGSGCGRGACFLMRLPVA